MKDLKQIVDEYADEFGWIDDDIFCVWVDWVETDDFLTALRELYGTGLFDDGGITAHVGDRYICFELSDGYIDIEGVYPKDEYRH